MNIKWIKAAVPVAVILLTAVILLASITIISSKPKSNMISWFEADIDNDNNNELLIITTTAPDMTLDTGESYGDYIKLYSDYKIVNNKPILKKNHEPDYAFDLSEIKPLKIQAGDINGDGVTELAVCVYKTAEFHPVLAKRPFFYDITDGELEPIWLGSRLARPFLDYILFDVDQDDIDEIISIELMENKNKVIVVYDWKGFGFEVKTLSDELEGEIAFLTNINCRDDSILVEIEGEKYQLDLDDNRILLSIY